MIRREKRRKEREKEIGISTYSLYCSTVGRRRDPFLKVSYPTTFSTNRFPLFDHLDSRGKEGGNIPARAIFRRIVARSIDEDRWIEEDWRSNPATVVLALLFVVVVGGVVGALSNASLTVVEATPYWTALYLSRSQGPASKVWLRWYWFGPRDVTRPHGGATHPPVSLPPRNLSPSAAHHHSLLSNHPSRDRSRGGVDSGAESGSRACASDAAAPLLVHA